eukprot:12002532-Alexandrium_andersonii.AAC.3
MVSRARPEAIRPILFFRALAYFSCPPPPRPPGFRISSGASSLPNNPGVTKLNSEGWRRGRGRAPN